MWKKTSVTILLGLCLSPSAVMAAAPDVGFDPFAGIVAGIAQGMAAGGDLLMESNYDGDDTGNGTRQAGNVIVGSPIAEHAQSAVVDGQLNLKMNGSNNTTQALNLDVHDGEVPVLIMQGAAIGTDGVVIASSNSDESIQAVNAVTR